MSTTTGSSVLARHSPVNMNLTRRKRRERSKDATVVTGLSDTRLFRPMTWRSSTDRMARRVRNDRLLGPIEPPFAVLRQHELMTRSVISIAKKGAGGATNAWTLLRRAGWEVNRKRLYRRHAAARGIHVTCRSAVPAVEHSTYDCFVSNRLMSLSEPS